MPILRSLLTVVLLVTPCTVTPALAAAQARSRVTTEIEIVLRFALQLANAPGVPTWNRDAEFRAASPAPQP